MLKKSIYPKTRRISNEANYTITEKLDGSNLSFYKLDGELHIAQRNSIFKLSEIDDEKQNLYKGLYGWLSENGQHLEESLNETSSINGEWIGMGKIKYGLTLDKRFYMFSKSNVYQTSDVSSDHTIRNIQYNNELFKYPFVNQEVPEYIGFVPVVIDATTKPSVSELDDLYDSYTSELTRNVEGFVVSDGTTPLKYVRLKNGKMQDHFE